MNKKISSALISVFYKDGIEEIGKALQNLGAKIYSTGGTQDYLEKQGIQCISVESITSYPSILGGRVKTLHPKIFGGILARRTEEQDFRDLQDYEIPEIDLVIVDLYPFEETLAQTDEESKIIEKIDIGGPSMLRAAAKNFKDVCVIANKKDYQPLLDILINQNGASTLEQRKNFAAKTFEIVMHYDIAISNYFNTERKNLRYGENPHQEAHFIGNLNAHFNQLHGKELSYNNLVDVDAAVQLMQDFANENAFIFSVIKHCNVCGWAMHEQALTAWQNALAGDPESAFGGIICSNKKITKEVAEAMHEIFFEVLIAPDFETEALEILQQKKNRILLQYKKAVTNTQQFKSILGGNLIQNTDKGNTEKWEEVGGRPSSEKEKIDLKIANILCKHLKSNAIAIVKNNQLVGKGCGQTSRIDALKQAILKAQQFGFDLEGSSLASDAFFPFDDCIRIAFESKISSIIQPGGSIRDKDSITFAKEHAIAMVLSGMRHFKH